MSFSTTKQNRNFAHADLIDPYIFFYPDDISTGIPYVRVCINGKTSVVQPKFHKLSFMEKKKKKKIVVSKNYDMLNEKTFYIKLNPFSDFTTRFYVDTKQPNWYEMLLDSCSSMCEKIMTKESPDVNYDTKVHKLLYSDGSELSDVISGCFFKRRVLTPQFKHCVKNDVNTFDDERCLDLQNEYDNSCSPYYNLKNYGTQTNTLYPSVFSNYLSLKKKKNKYLQSKDCGLYQKDFAFQRNYIINDCGYEKITRGLAALRSLNFDKQGETVFPNIIGSNFCKSDKLEKKYIRKNYERYCCYPSVIEKNICDNSKYLNDRKIKALNFPGNVCTMKKCFELPEKITTISIPDVQTINFAKKDTLEGNFMFCKDPIAPKKIFCERCIPNSRHKIYEEDQYNLEKDAARNLLKLKSGNLQDNFMPKKKLECDHFKFSYKMDPYYNESKFDCFAIFCSQFTEKMRKRLCKKLVAMKNTSDMYVFMNTNNDSTNDFYQSNNLANLLFAKNINLDIENHYEKNISGFVFKLIVDDIDYSNIGSNYVGFINLFNKCDNFQLLYFTMQDIIPIMVRKLCEMINGCLLKLFQEYKSKIMSMEETMTSKLLLQKIEQRSIGYELSINDDKDGFPKQDVNESIILNAHLKEKSDYSRIIENNINDYFSPSLLKCFIENNFFTEKNNDVYAVKTEIENCIKDLILSKREEIESFQNKNCSDVKNFLDNFNKL